MTAPRISFMTRAQWHAAPERPAHLSLRSEVLYGTTFHHTTGTNLGSTDTAAWARNIQNFCFGRGYGDIEYNAMIRAYIDPHDHQPRGVFLTGRDIHWVGAHATSTDNVANRRTTGVALMGDARQVFADPRLAPTAKALIDLAWYFQLTYSHAHHVAHTQRFGHRDWHDGLGGIATICPGDPMLAYVHTLKG